MRFGLTKTRMPDLICLMIESASDELETVEQFHPGSCPELVPTRKAIKNDEYCRCPHRCDDLENQFQHLERTGIESWHVESLKGEPMLANVQPCSEGYHEEYHRPQRAAPGRQEVDRLGLDRRRRQQLELDGLPRQRMQRAGDRTLPARQVAS